MSDDPTPAARPTVRAGGTLDLSTGPAAPPPPPPAPRRPATPDPDVRVGKVLDLSRKGGGGEPPRRSVSSVLGHGPVIRETIDLSTERRPAPRPQAPAAQDAPRAARREPSGGPSQNTPAPRRQEQTPRGMAPKATSSSLADLLDPEVLAKLRGEG